MKPGKRRPTTETTPQAPALQPEVRIGFSPGAQSQFDGLPAKVRAGLRRKLHEFGENPALGKPLVGPLQGYHRVTYGRVRAIAMQMIASFADGIVVVHVLWVGLRKAGSSDDAYERAAIAALRAGDPDAHAILEQLLQVEMTADGTADE
jgi:mRNA-degrading endonuclease RelE of RelBE toxin-antitoxin system